MIGRLAAGALAAFALVLGAALPAQAAPSDSVLVSTDGVTFSPTLPAGVFPSAVLIPGGSTTASLYVKNDSAVPSELFVTASGVASSSGEFARALTLRAVSAASPNGPAIRLGSLARCATLLAEVLPPGSVTRITLTLAMADVAAQVAQNETITASLGLALHQSDTGVTPVSGCDLTGIQLPVLGLPGDGGLAFTGSAIVYPALMTVGALLGAGSLFVVVAHRRRQRAR